MLDEIMEERGLSRRQTVPKAGFSQPLFSQYVKGAKSIRVDEVDRLCEVLGVATMSVWVEAERRLGGGGQVLAFPGKPGLSPDGSTVDSPEQAERAALGHDVEAEIEAQQDQP